MSTSISSMFCFNSSDDGNYAPETSKGDFMKPLIAQEPKKEASATDQYPGYALRTAHPNDCTPENKTFVKTGGNALQAVDKSVLEEKNLVAVTVPDNHLRPGDTLLVLSPDGSRTVSARIPEGHGAGSVFFVSFAAPVVATVLPGSDDLPIVQAIDPNQPATLDLELAEDNGKSKNLVLVTVPETSRAGDMIHVQLPDQRIVEAIVPDGNSAQFYVQAPPLAVNCQQQGQESSLVLPKIV